VRAPFEIMEMYSEIPSSAVSSADRLVSAGSTGLAGANDAFSPSVTPRGAPKWSFIALLFWLAGTLASCLRIVVGRSRVLGITAKAPARVSSRHRRLLKQLASHALLKRRVLLTQSAETAVPFTCRIIKPVVLLPSSAEGWPEERLRAVHLHELRHIRRWDLLTQSAALVICSLFWFMPLVWTAYAHLCLEQEKACDAGVVGDGVKNIECATCLLHTALLSREPAQFTGLFFAGGRKRDLEERIHASDGHP
jgi:beta-lactamase regulating signal transducer with metallopeptidase domain